MTHYFAARYSLIAVLMIGLCAFGSVYAAGTIDFIAGNVTINNYKNEMRAPQLNDKLNVGDTIITGRDGELHITTDDQGIIAVRPSTQLQLDTYKAEGGSDDSVVFNLLRGSFRSVSGWVGKKHPQGYQVRTPTATIKVGDADHETLVIEGGSSAGTYDKVNIGSTLLDTTFGKVDVHANQAGFVSRSAADAPKVLAEIPAVFQPIAYDARINEEKAAADKAQDNSQKQAEEGHLKDGSGTGVNATSDKPKIGNADDQREARAALDELFRYYEAGNINFIRNRLDPSMIGFQKLLDNISTEVNQCKQMRVRFFNTQVQAGPDIASIQTNWEKRCLMLPAFTPRVDTGFTTFLMHKQKSGWGMAALSNDNPFVSAGRTATLTASSGTTCNTIQSLSSPTPLPFNITLNDPDMASSPTASVILTTVQGENETITLNAVGGGMFVVNTLTINRAVPIANDGIVEIVPTLIPAALFTAYSCPAVTVRYIDNTTSSGSSQTVQATAPIN